MSNDSRDDAALRQFKSRAQQPKVLASGGAANPVKASRPMVFIVEFDHPGVSDGCGSTTMSDQIDASRYAPARITQPLASCGGAKRMAHASMCGAFEF